MASSHKTVQLTIFFALAFSLLITASPSAAQATQPSSQTSTLASGGPNPVAVADADVATAAPPVDPQAQPASTTPPATSADDDQWHFAILPYLWFPGMHGTVGARYREVSVHASAGDILSNFRFGLAGGVEFRKQRMVIPIDLMWVRLEDDKALPFPDLGASSANVKIGEFLFTPEIGYRLVDQKKFKADFVTGVRFWHLYENLSFSPGDLGLSASGSLNWVDPIFGGRMQFALSPKVAVNIFGDAGGFGAGANLDYQIAGLLGYQINPKWALQAGWRYLYVDYRSQGTVFNVTMPGVMGGVTYTFK